MVWVVGFRVYRCIDMNGFRVECQQLGTARTETVARPGECRRIGHATKLHRHSLKSHNTDEDPRFGGPIPVTVGTFETKVRPLRGFRALPLGGGGGIPWGGGGGGVPTRDTRPYIGFWATLCIWVNPLQITKPERSLRTLRPLDPKPTFRSRTLNPKPKPLDP